MSSAAPEIASSDIIMTVRLQFKPGTLNGVLRKLVPFALKTREEEGNICVEIYRSMKDADQLIVFERWRDQDAIDKHMRGQNTSEVLELYDKNLLDPSSIMENVTILKDTMLS